MKVSNTRGNNTRGNGMRGINLENVSQLDDIRRGTRSENGHFA